MHLDEDNNFSNIITSLVLTSSDIAWMASHGVGRIGRTTYHATLKISLPGVTNINIK